MCNSSQLALRRHVFVLLLGVLSAVPGPAWSAPAGQVLFATADVTAVDQQGNRRAVHKGAAIDEGDTVFTGNGRVQIQFKDGGFVGLQPGSHFKVERYRYTAAGDAEDGVVMALIKGGLRTVSGLVGKRDRRAYEMRTAIATIGIRGTEYALELDTTLVGHVTHGAIEVCNGGGCLGVPSGQAFLVRSPSDVPILTQRRAFLPPAGAVARKRAAAQSDAAEDETDASVAASSSDRGEDRADSGDPAHAGGPAVTAQSDGAAAAPPVQQSVADGVDWLRRAQADGRSATGQESAASKGVGDSALDPATEPSNATRAASDAPATQPEPATIGATQTDRAPAAEIFSIDPIDDNAPRGVRKRSAADGSPLSRHERALHHHEFAARLRGPDSVPAASVRPHSEKVNPVPAQIQQLGDAGQLSATLSAPGPAPTMAASNTPSGIEPPATEAVSPALALPLPPPPVASAPSPASAAEQPVADALRQRGRGVRIGIEVERRGVLRDRVLEFLERNGINIPAAGRLR